jgi:hypothetical protein
MTRAEKIQAAIDALPNATGGDWKPDGRVGALSNEDGNVPLAFPITQLRRKNPDGDDIRANLTLISAARELAEEVVRLRWLAEAHQSGSLARLREAYGFEKSLGDQIVDAVSRQSGIPRVELIKPIPKGSGDNALGPAAYARRLARHPKKRGEEPPMGQYDEEPL